MAIEYGDTPVLLSFLHAIRLLASISRQEVDRVDTVAEDERDAGSKESGVESLHASSDESGPEERTERRRERRRDSAVEPVDELVDESASRQPPYALLPVPAADPIPFDAELAAVQAEAELLTRDEAVHDGLSPDDETCPPPRQARRSCCVCCRAARHVDSIVRSWCGTRGLQRSSRR